MLQYHEPSGCLNGFFRQIGAQAHLPRDARKHHRQQRRVQTVQFSSVGKGGACRVRARRRLEGVVTESDEGRDTHTHNREGESKKWHMVETRTVAGCLFGRKSCTSQMYGSTRKLPKSLLSYESLKKNSVNTRMPHFCFSKYAVLP